MTTQRLLALLTVALACALLVFLIRPGDPLEEEPTDLSISLREYEVLAWVIHPSDAHVGLRVSVLDPWAGGHPSRYAKAVGELVQSLEQVDSPPSSKFMRVTQADASNVWEAVRDFSRKNGRAWELDDRFENTGSLQLANRIEIDAIREPGASIWKEFFRWFPDAWELVTVSRVGFSHDGSVAIVYISRGRGMLFGRGGLVVLKAFERGFEVIGEYGGWVS